MIKYQCYVMEDVDLAGLELSIPGLRGKFWLRCIGCFYVLPTWIMYTLEPIQKKHRPQNLETIFGIFALPVWYFCTLLFCDIFNVFASSSVTEDPAIKEQEPPKKVSPIYFSQKKVSQTIFSQRVLCLVPGLEVEGVQDVHPVYQSGKGKTSHCYPSPSPPT